MFWIVIGIILSINFPDVTNIIRMPTKLGYVNELKTSIYTFPIIFSVYMSLATSSFLALLYTFKLFKDYLKK